MDYQIVATLGPASAQPAVWQAMLEAGVTAFRLNTSHLSLDQLSAWLDQLESFRQRGPRAVPLVLDLQGSKWRLGEFPPCALTPGETVLLIHAPAAQAAGTLPVPHADFFRAAPGSNGQVVLNDAKSRLVIEAVGPDWLRARVVQGGPLLPHKGITLGDSPFRAETLSDKDRAICAATGGLAGVRYAISYVRDAAEMAGYRALLGRQAGLIAKLERAPALAEVEAMAGPADELWLCRGDLGAELGPVGMAEAAARFTEQVSGLPVPALLAGQVLEHMTEHPTATRSEICCLYDALRRGYQGVVLSDEAAVGRHPVESCRTAALFK